MLAKAGFLKKSESDEQASKSSSSKDVKTKTVMVKVMNADGKTNEVKAAKGLQGYEASPIKTPQKTDPTSKTGSKDQARLSLSDALKMMDSPAKDSKNKSPPKGSKLQKPSPIIVKKDGHSTLQQVKNLVKKGSEFIKKKIVSK